MKYLVLFFTNNKTLRK